MLDAAFIDKSYTEALRLIQMGMKKVEVKNMPCDANHSDYFEVGVTQDETYTLITYQNQCACHLLIDTNSVTTDMQQMI